MFYVFKVGYVRRYNISKFESGIDHAICDVQNTDYLSLLLFSVLAIIIDY